MAHDLQPRPPRRQQATGHASTLRLVLPSGRIVGFDQDTVSIGRDPACDVVVEDDSVSPQHVSVERHPQGWLVADQASRTGTFVDGQRVTQQLLKPGQELRLGSACLRIASPGSAPPPSAAGARATRPDFTAARLAAAPARATEAIPTAGEAAAAASLGIWPGANAEEILHRFEQMCQDFRARMERAGSPDEQAALERELQGVRSACYLLLNKGGKP